ncbi:nuclear pore complex protein Nup50 [Anopheles bellator]|uniref:nuclear pore complex protein Nup50 n=1 Tax=Anopheles bellator TaxID=139047 RepID=UPI002649D060|nr:nuclear pore complex protein Nup50 [Anopheles bellator]
MAKRVAQSSLNHMNWNEDEEPEEVGEFAKASEEVIKQRVIKKARRRVDGAADSTAAGSAPSVFGGFKGFSALQPEETPATGGTKSFSFLAGLGAAKPNGNTAGSSAGGSTISSSTPMFSFGSNAGSTLADSSKKFTFGTPSNLKLDSTPAAVSDKPTTGFTFSASKDNGSADRNKTMFGGAKSISGEAGAPTSTFSFGSTAPKSDATTTADAKSTFTFGSAAKKDTASEAGAATFSFGSIPAPKPAESTAAKTFTFGSSSAKDVGSGATDKKATYSFGMPAASKETVVVDKKSFSFGTAKETSEETVKKMFSFADTAAKTAADNGADSSKKDVPLGSLSQKKDGDGADGAKKSSGFTFGSLSSSSPSALKTDSADAASKKPVFGGFGITPSKEPAVALAAEVPKQTFSFGSLPAKEPEPKVAEPKAPFAGFAGTTFGAKPSATTATNKDNNTANANKEFEKNVVALNKSFITWVTKHVEANAFCKLHVVFKDYEKHFAKLESDKTALRPAPAKEKESTEVVAKDKEKEVAKPMFSFGSIPKESPVKLPVPAAATFSFGSSKPFSFGSPGGGITSSSSTTKSPTSTAAVSTFSPSFFAGASTFGSQPSAGGFSFGSVAKPAGDTGNKETDEGDGGDGTDEPPKVEFTPVEEKDSVYSKRCKLFVKAAGAYSDRGVGTVHIKQVDGKVQVLVRADTNLGNVLLNIILNESVPLQRMGKNNVMMICLPTPDSKPPPTSVLLRVKTGPEADELYETLLKHKPK